MTCATMLDAMLEAELDELRLAVETPLSLHLRGCARCRAVADRLARDTDSLARLVAPVGAEPRESLARRTRVHTWQWQAASLAAAAAVAAAVVVVLRAPRPSAAPTAATAPTAALAPRLVMQPMPAASPVSARQRRTGSSIRLDRRAPRDLGPAIIASTVEVSATPAIQAERAVAIAPVRLEVAPRSSLGSGVVVDPPTGRRATIIPTDRPGVTVVWLHQ